MGGKKYDDGKLPLQLLPYEFLRAAARAFSYGAQKYSPRNWEQGGIGYERLFGALMRHMWTYHSGETHDDESGLSHLDHACACLAMLVATVEREGRNTDDATKLLELLDWASEITENQPRNAREVEVYKAGFDRGYEDGYESGKTSHDEP